MYYSCSTYTCRLLHKRSSFLSQPTRYTVISFLWEGRECAIVHGRRIAGEEQMNARSHPNWPSTFLGDTPAWTLNTFNIRWQLNIDKKKSCLQNNSFLMILNHTQTNTLTHAYCLGVKNYGTLRMLWTETFWEPLWETENRTLPYHPLV